MDLLEKLLYHIKESATNQITVDTIVPDRQCKILLAFIVDHLGYLFILEKKQDSCVVMIRDATELNETDYDVKIGFQTVSTNNEYQVSSVSNLHNFEMKLEILNDDFTKEDLILFLYALEASF